MAINKTKAGTFVVDFRDQTGRRLRKTFDTLRAAREYDRISKGDISKNEFVAPTGITIKDAAEDWLSRKTDSGGYRPATLQNWRTHLDKYIIPSLGDRKIQQVDSTEIEAAATAWKSQTSGYTANMVLRTLSAYSSKPSVAGVLSRESPTRPR